jgi:hypothetical protein
MVTIKIATTAASDVNESTLKLAPARLLTFLQGVADPAIRAQFAPLGWSEQRLEEAWSLLNELKAGNVIPAIPAPDPLVEAMASCEAWQATGLIRARAMLQLTHPEQATFLFHDFVAGKGTEAVLNVATFLQRRHALEKSIERKPSRAADHEALAVIEQTGTTKETLKELQAMVDAVQSVAPTESAPALDVDARRLATLRKIYAWITAWSEMARTVITRRDQMIKLGIAKRRSHKAKGAVVTPPAPPVTPAPPVVVAPTTPAVPAVPPAASPIEEVVAPESRAA